MIGPREAVRVPISDGKAPQACKAQILRSLDRPIHDEAAVTQILRLQVKTLIKMLRVGISPKQQRIERESIISHKACMSLANASLQHLPIVLRCWSPLELFVLSLAGKDPSQPLRLTSQGIMTA